MKKSVRNQIFDFLRSNTGSFPAGELQRMEFKSERGGLATGDTIKRRCQELAEEGKIFVEQRAGIAHYSATYNPPKPKQTYRIRDPLTGTLMEVT